jgi:hypothetical protein
MEIVMLPVVYQPSDLKQYLNTYHGYGDKPKVEEEYVEYQVIKASDVRQRIVDYLGKVLARCWINPSLLKELEADPHQCLFEMGMILPEELTIHVVTSKKNRPRLVVYEITNGVHKKICYLQLSMIASKI